jgi:signal transduction histidine kinase
VVSHQVLTALGCTLSLAVTGVIAWRFANGTAPRRRALAIGAPVAVLFLLSEAAYRGLFALWPDGLPPSARPIADVLQWSLAVTRALIWYGFFFALIAAELQAGRVLKRLVSDCLGRPSFRVLEGMLRRPLGDPGLRLGFWRSDAGNWGDADGAPLEPPGAGQVITEIEREGPRLAIVHDAQLANDPELLQAAGAAVVLAEENAELEASWNASLHELAESRARLASTAERERRKLERDLHDGAQQRLMGIQIRVRRAQEQARDDRLAGELEAISVDAEQAVDELRTLAHGIYPPVLRAFGLADALHAFALKAPIPVAIDDAGIGRCPRIIETAIYFCAAEAVQNAIKHAGDGAHVKITLARDQQRVRFAIADDGRGMGGQASPESEGLIGMRDRIGAVGGELEVVSSPGAGTTVRGTVPLDGPAASNQHEEVQ